MKILIVKLGAFGDICFALPLVQSLKLKIPNAEIDWVVDQSYADFLRQYEGIGRLIEVDTQKLYRGTRFQKLQFVLDLRSSIDHYDKILLLHRNKSYLAALLGKGQVYQLSRKTDINDAGMFPAIYQGVPQGPVRTQESLLYKSLAERALGAAIALEDWKFPEPTPTLPSDLISSLPENSIFFHIGGGDNKKTNFNLKKWPYFVSLVELCLKNKIGPLILLGTKVELAELGALPASDQLINLCGQTKLADFPFLAKRAKLFVGPDSGPLHFFDQAGVASIGLFGPTSEISWGVIGKHSLTMHDPIICHPCYKDDGVFPTCPINQQCMRDLQPSRVFDQIRKIYSETRA